MKQWKFFFKIMQKEKSKEMSFWDHAEQLRWLLIRSIFAWLTLSVFAFLYKDFIFDTIIFFPTSPDFPSNQLLCWMSHQWLNSETLCINTVSINIINTEFAGQFKLHIAASLIIGLLLSIPYLTMELWWFIKPALKPNEKKIVRKASFWSCLLFLLGVAFSYFILIPFTINFLGTYSVSSRIENLISFSSYITTMVSIVLWTGVIFELPIIILFFAKLGMLSPKFMIRNRKYAIVIILVLAAIITPPDVFSQIMVSIPLLLLYEIGIIIAKRIWKKNIEV